MKSKAQILIAYLIDFIDARGSAGVCMKNSKICGGLSHCFCWAAGVCGGFSVPPSPFRGITPLCSLRGARRRSLRLTDGLEGVSLNGVLRL